MSDRSPSLDALLSGEELGGVHDLFRRRVEVTPEATFLLWEEQRWSYTEAWAELTRFAGWVSTHACRPPEVGRVASYLPNRPEVIWTWLGALAAGAVYVPLNRAHRGDLLGDMLARSGARTLVTDEDGLAVLADAADLRELDRVLIVGEQPVVTPTGLNLRSWAEVECSEAVEPAVTAPTDLAGLLYSSGTTGRSKAVTLTHSQISLGAAWVAWSLEMDQSDTLHAWLPLYHIAGQVDSVLPVVISGGTVALFPTFSRSRFWSQVKDVEASIFIGFSNIVELLWTLPDDVADASTTLRAGIMGKIPVELHRAFEARFGLRLYDVYGMTEIEPLALPRPGEVPPVGSCGRPRPDLDVQIHDDAGRPAGPEQPGEIVCRSRGPAVITPGYEGDSAATAEAERDGWFHTADIGKIDREGFVHFIDRRKHAIRRRGENISTWELEAQVTKHAAVRECSAVGVPSPLGEDDVKVAVTAARPGALDPEELFEWCRGRMASFMVPRFIELLDELPRAPTGKVLKEELRWIGPGTWDAETARPRNRNRDG